MLIILLAIFTCNFTQVVPIGLCTSNSKELPGEAQLLSQPHRFRGSELHSVARAQLYGEDRALKLQTELFRSMEKKYAGFFSTLPEKFEAASTQPPSSLHSKALTESLFLTLLHRQNSLLSAIYFHFYLKGREELGLYVQQTQTGLFCSALDRGLLPPK